jgi:hypothetical protein
MFAISSDFLYLKISDNQIEEYDKNNLNISSG